MRDIPVSFLTSSHSSPGLCQSQAHGRSAALAGINTTAYKLLPPCLRTELCSAPYIIGGMPISRLTVKAAQVPSLHDGGFDLALSRTYSVVTKRAVLHAPLPFPPAGGWVEGWALRAVSIILNFLSPIPIIVAGCVLRAPSWDSWQSMHKFT